MYIGLEVHKNPESGMTNSRPKPVSFKGAHFGLSYSMVIQRDSIFAGIKYVWTRSNPQAIESKPRTAKHAVKILIVETFIAGLYELMVFVLSPFVLRSLFTIARRRNRLDRNR